MAMSREVDKLRAELTNSTNFDPRTGIQGRVCFEYFDLIFEDQLSEVIKKLKILNIVNRS